MTSAATPTLSAAQKQHLLALLETGLPRCARPYLTLAEMIGTDEETVLKHVRSWNADGLFRRFGLVVKHHKLGITANAMLVLDIPDEQVDALGPVLAEEPDVTLCYRRQRQLPEWPYNLFCMVHGRERSVTQARVTAMLSRLGLENAPHQILFSVRAFKQRGARFSPSNNPHLAKVRHE